MPGRERRRPSRPGPARATGSTNHLPTEPLASPDQGEIAQLVEHTTENRGVPGSSPGLATS